MPYHRVPPEKFVKTFRTVLCAIFCGNPRKKVENTVENSESYLFKSVQFWSHIKKVKVF